MKSDLLYLFRLLRHYFSSRSKFDIHSPFVYKIYSEIIKDKTDYAEYPSTATKTNTGNTSYSNKDNRLLFRLCRYFKTKNLLILGTSDGTSASYLTSGSPDGLMINIHDGFGLITDSVMFDMVIVFDDMPGSFIPDFFPRIIQHIHNDSVLIFCNKTGSEEMNNAWNETCDHPSVTVTIDLFSVGLAFCKEGLTKEDFILRY